MVWSSSHFVEAQAERPKAALEQAADGRDGAIHLLGDFSRRTAVKMTELDGLPLVVRELGV